MAAGVLCAAVAGCGGADETTADPFTPTGSPKEQIASTVNEMFSAWNDGDGELACSLMTERGQQLAVRIAGQFHDLQGSIAPDDCVEAVEQSAEAVDGEIGQAVKAWQVKLEGEDRATVISKYRGAMSMQQVDGRWLVVVPTFVD